MLACSGTAKPPRGLGPRAKSECSKNSPRAQTAIPCVTASDSVPGSGVHIVPGGLKPFSWNASPKALSRGTAEWQAPQARLKRRAKAGSARAGTAVDSRAAATSGSRRGRAMRARPYSGGSTERQLATRRERRQGADPSRHDGGQGTGEERQLHEGPDPDRRGDEMEPVDQRRHRPVRSGVALEAAEKEPGRGQGGGEARR